MSDTPTYDQLSALCAQLAAELKLAKSVMLATADLASTPTTIEVALRDHADRVETTLTAYRTLTPDPVYAEAKTMFEALQNTYDDLNGGFVACVKCGSQEDTTDLDCMSLYIIPAINRARGEG